MQPPTTKLIQEVMQFRQELDDFAADLQNTGVTQWNEEELQHAVLTMRNKLSTMKRNNRRAVQRAKWAGVQANKL